MYATNFDYQAFNDKILCNIILNKTVFLYVLNSALFILYCYLNIYNLKFYIRWRLLFYELFEQF